MSKSNSYKAVGSSRPSLILTEEEEKWLQDHPLLPEEEKWLQDHPLLPEEVQIVRLQRMLNDLAAGENRMNNSKKIGPGPAEHAQRVLTKDVIAKEIEMLKKKETEPQERVKSKQETWIVHCLYINNGRAMIGVADSRSSAYSLCKEMCKDISYAENYNPGDFIKTIRKVKDFNQVVIDLT